MIQETKKSDLRIGSGDFFQKSRSKGDELDETEDRFYIQYKKLLLVLQLRSDTDLLSRTLSLRGQKTHASLQNRLFFFFLKQPKKKNLKMNRSGFIIFCSPLWYLAAFIVTDLTILLPEWAGYFKIAMQEVPVWDNLLSGERVGVFGVWWKSWGNSLTFLEEPHSWGRVNTVVSGLPLNP